MNSRRNKILTEDQAKVWDSIIGKRMVKKDKQSEVIFTKKTTDIEYMENCLFWIKEARAGRCDASKEKSAANSTIEHCKNILNR